jgi:hypothetical protein
MTPAITSRSANAPHSFAVSTTPPILLLSLTAQLFDGLQDGTRNLFALRIRDPRAVTARIDLAANSGSTGGNFFVSRRGHCDTLCA